MSYALTVFLPHLRSCGLRVRPFQRQNNRNVWCCKTFCVVTTLRSWRRPTVWLHVTWKRQGICCVKSDSRIRSTVQNVSSEVVTGSWQWQYQLSGVSFISLQLCCWSLLLLEEGKHGKFFWMCLFLWKETLEAKYTCLKFTKTDALDRLSVLGRSREWRLYKCCVFHRQSELICVLYRGGLYIDGPAESVRTCHGPTPSLPPSSPRQRFG
jgi:hypothetical protein